MEYKLQKTDAQTLLAFDNLKSFQDVCDLLEVPFPLLRNLLYENKATYNKFIILKKNGKEREISAPITNLKIIQKKLQYILNLKNSFKNCVQGYVDDRGIKSNAQFHKKQKFVLTIDLEDFFPSITFPRVYGLFKSSPYSFSTPVAAALANICCHEKKLPQGAPTSPIISNLICRKLDNQLIKIASQNHLFYTRYADDLTFSSHKALADHVFGYLNDAESEKNIILKTVKENGFKPNYKKVRIKNRKFDRLEVTGLTVNEKINVSRTFYKRIRSALHAWEKHGYDMAQEVYINKYYDQLSRKTSPTKHLRLVLKGEIQHFGYIRGFGDEVYLKLLKRLWDQDKSLLSPREFNQKIKPYIKKTELIRKSVWIVQSYEKDPVDMSQGTAFGYEGSKKLITAAHCIKNPNNITLTQPGYRTGEINATEIYRNETLDISILELQYEVKAETLPLRSSSQGLELGQVIVAGFPDSNLKDKAHLVITNAATRSIFMDIEYLALSSGIAYGMSGGPVTDHEGKVFGVAVRGAQDITETSSKKLCLPIEYLQDILNIYLDKKEDSINGK